MGTKSTIKLSFVLPVYNVQDYLCECIDSICQQDTTSCEILLVNDGATDRSGEICNEYSERYENVRVIHKENGGLSSARNAGLKETRGKYVAFVDSDDRIDRGSLKKILAWIDEADADICFMQVIKFFPDGQSTSMAENIARSQVLGHSHMDVLEYLSHRPKYPGSVCSKLFRRAFLMEHDLWFPPDRRYSEDLGFIRDCLLKAERFDVLECPYYEYRQNRPGSITFFRTEQKFWDLSLFVSDTVQMLTADKKAVDDNAECIMSFVAYEYFILLWYCRGLPQETRAKAYAFLEDYRWVMEYSRTTKGKLFRVVVKLFGLRVASGLLEVYMKWRPY